MKKIPIVAKMGAFVADFSGWGGVRNLFEVLRPCEGSVTGGFFLVERKWQI